MWTNDAVFCINSLAPERFNYDNECYCTFPGTVLYISWKMDEFWGYEMWSNYPIHYINSLVSERQSCDYECMIFKYFLGYSFVHFLWQCPRVNAAGLLREANVGLGNGLLPDSTKALPEAVLAKFCGDTWLWWWTLCNLCHKIKFINIELHCHQLCTTLNYLISVLYINGAFQK